MKRKTMTIATTAAMVLLGVCCGATVTARADAPASLAIDLTKPGPALPPTFYGPMTEEINHSYDGGLYAELIQNRSFQDNAQTPVHWTAVQVGGGEGSLALDTPQPLSPALPVSLRLDTSKGGGRVGAANDGYWGIPVKPQTTYQASFYARAASGFSGPVTLALESADGSRTYAQARQSGLTAGWKRYTATLKTGADAPALGRFTVTTDRPGTVWLNLVSLFPPTYNARANGFRSGLMEKMAAMRPGFLRLPGGNYVEGNTVAERFDWKKTVGPWTERPGHPSPWGYRSSDGLGLLEFLGWCEDLKMDPVLAVYAGYSLRGEHVNSGPDLQPYVQDALDEIEYITGDKNTKSGSYDARFTQFYDAIKAKYPHLQLIATTGGKDSIGQRFPVKMRTPDVVDEHYYQSAEQMQRNAHKYDTYDRKRPKVFVGEWAAFDKVAPWEQKATEGGPTSSFISALGDAAWMTGLERNCDVVVMECYAPMFVNINPGARQWAINLIGYDALTSFGSPSYYVQTMFGQDHGDVVVPAALTGDKIFESVTRDTKTGRVYVKLVNTADTAQPVHITLNGAQSFSPTGTALILSSLDLTAVNTLTQPEAVVPVAAPVTGISRDFTYTAAPYSVTVLQLQARG